RTGAGSNLSFSSRRHSGTRLGSSPVRHGGRETRPASESAARRSIPAPHGSSVAVPAETAGKVAWSSSGCGPSVAGRATRGGGGMLAMADWAQQGLFDSSWCGNVVPRDSFYGLLAEQGERIVRDEDFADCYAEGRGRPSIP